MRTVANGNFKVVNFDDASCAFEDMVTWSDPHGHGKFIMTNKAESHVTKQSHMSHDLLPRFPKKAF
jgi:hypothetical protein